MFIRYISHEIRNPLNHVMLGLDHLEEGINRGAFSLSRKDTLGDIKESCRSCLKVLDDMLTSDKIRSGFLVLEKHDVNIIDWLSMVVDKFLLQASREESNICLSQRNLRMRRLTNLVFFCLFITR